MRFVSAAALLLALFGAGFGFERVVIMEESYQET